MREIIEKKWSELLPIWQQLFDKNKNITPFQSYEFLTFTGKGKPYFKDPFRLVGVKELNLVLYRDNEAIAIAPLLIKKKNNKSAVYFRGHFTKASDLDFIYYDWSYEDFKFLIDGIKNMLGDISFFLDRVAEDSVACDYLRKYFSTGKIKKKAGVCLFLPDSYEEWYRSLHNSIRGSLNNHKNRLERDQIQVSTCFYFGEEIDDNICKKMMFVYADRFLNKNRFRFGPLKKLVVLILRSVLIKDKITKWMNSVHNNFHVILYFDNEIAAFSNRITCKNKRIILSRTAINTKFRKYSPGGVLIKSIVQYIIDLNNTGNLGINMLDMGEGNDNGMEYKEAYGGKPYSIYSFID